MSWIVTGEENGKIVLVSKSDTDFMLPKGSYLTIEDDDKKFILRVDEVGQNYAYSPSPMIVDMDLSPLLQDKKCQHTVKAYRVMDVTDRIDGIEYIKPQSIARRSTQEEIDLSLGNTEKGPRIFLATLHASKNQHLTDENGNFITAKLPEDMFYHQIMICGKTGRGKTVAAKYLAQYFVENLRGAVLAVNVKEADLLKMNKESKTHNQEVEKEWEILGEKKHGIENFVIYYPANTIIRESRGVDAIKKPITLDVKKIDPESLNGLLQGISDTAARNLPDIFRYWKETELKKHTLKFKDFKDYFNAIGKESEKELKRLFKTMNTRLEESEIKLPSSTYDNIQRCLNNASIFFDNVDADVIDEKDILLEGKMSVIDVFNAGGDQFGAVLLRDLLKRIVEAKSNDPSLPPILIIIDEVHRFYDTESTKETLGYLDYICRTGRQSKIGVIFSSQEPRDLPPGLSTVINSKIIFASDIMATREYGVRISPEEMESLGNGYAWVSIYGLPQLKIVKFPLSFAGVFEGG